MGIAADSLFNVLMSWVRALVNALWALFSADRTTALEFLGKNWMTIAAVIIVCGLVIDWLIWLIRWQPYHLWARKLRRLLRLDEPDEEELPKKGKAHAAAFPENRYARSAARQPDAETPLYLHGMDEEEAQDWSEEPFDYPDMDDESAYQDESQYTRVHSALKQNPPGDWQLRMQEEARARAAAEQARRAQEAYEAEQARLAQEAFEAEQARLAQEAYEAEQARLAQEAYEAEQACLAQEEYERQLEEYERQRAQYERDLAEYERQKAEYEAQLASQQACDAVSSASRRRRMAAAPSQEETQIIRVKTPAHPAKPNAGQAKPKAKPSVPAKAQKQEKHAEPKADKSNSLLGRVAKMIEPEEEEIISRRSLPPRVDMNDAFRTAKLPIVTPPRAGRRKK